MSGEVERHRREFERLHDGMVVELDRRFTGRDRAIGIGHNDPDVDEEVASTISVIRQVAQVIADLQETIRQQEELIYDQRQGLAEFQHRSQKAFAELAETERTLQAERERAERAESKAQGGEAQIKRLEDYCVSLKSHLNSLMAVVRDSLSVPEKAPRSLEDRSA